MSNDSAVSFKVGKIKPGESKEFILYLYINQNSQKYILDEIEIDVEKIRNLDTVKEILDCKKYWRKYLKEHDGLEILEDRKTYKWIDALETTEGKVEAEELLNKVRKVYARSILLFPLLTNAKTGGISAALEVDEEKDKCGRYSYCWPRDAVFITKALDLVKMDYETSKFYTIFSKQTQNTNGMWEQRFYTDCRLAPCWGYQIDETASIVFGVYEHYKIIKNKKFLKDTFWMCKKAIEFLEKYIDYIVDNIESTGKEKKDGKTIAIEKENSKKLERFEISESYDLWEMFEGIHLYSLSAIYGAFEAMKCIYRELEEIEYKDETEKNVKEMLEYATKTKQYVLEELCNKETKTLKRNNKDNIVDISILGALMPFGMFSTKQKNTGNIENSGSSGNSGNIEEIEEKIKIKNTIEKIDLSLRTYTGGYLRFEQDTYIGGKNPWPIATMWMAIYYMQIGKKQEAIKCLKFVTETCTNLGLLAEQIDNETLQSKWVIGLGWSHAMYIILLGEIGTGSQCDILS